MGSSISKIDEEENALQWLKSNAKWEAKKVKMIDCLQSMIDELEAMKFQQHIRNKRMDDISYLLENEVKILANKNLIDLIGNWR